MFEFNERTEYFVEDTINDCIAEIQLRCKRYMDDQKLTKLDLDLIEREIMARLAYASVKGR